MSRKLVFTREKEPSAGWKQCFMPRKEVVARRKHVFTSRKEVSASRKLVSPSQKSAAIVEEDKEISTFPLGIAAANIRVVPVDQIFQK